MFNSDTVHEGAAPDKTDTDTDINADVVEIFVFFSSPCSPLFIRQADKGRSDAQPSHR